jgi:hypothetical protein
VTDIGWRRTEVEPMSAMQFMKLTSSSHMHVTQPLYAAGAGSLSVAVFQHRIDILSIRGARVFVLSE